MVSRSYGIGKVCAGALLAGVLLVGFSAPASAKGPACPAPAKTGVTLKVVRPGISIVLKKGTIQPVKVVRKNDRHDCRKGEKSWRKGQHRGGWHGKNEHRSHYRRGNDCCDNHRRDDWRKDGCRH